MANLNSKVKRVLIPDKYRTHWKSYTFGIAYGKFAPSFSILNMLPIYMEHFGNKLQQVKRSGWIVGKSEKRFIVMDFYGPEQAILQNLSQKEFEKWNKLK
jgi:hypothetical protein